jgi:hypothetical protein
LRKKDATFGVEVTIPDAYPTTVTNLVDEAEAERRIARHKSSPGMSRQGVVCPISYPRGGIGGQILATLLGGASMSATAAATSGGGISIGSIVSDLAGGASAAQT